MITYGKQTISEKDIKEVVLTLKSDWLTTGPKVEEFETKFAKYVGAKYAVSVSSGTAGLHLACLAADLREGEELITTPMTFAASANCAFYCKAKPVFADIIPENGLIDPIEIKSKINPKTKIIIPVHYGGLSCDMEEIKKIADDNNLIIIEDACHALGGKYKKSKIGDCKYSNMSVFSFHPVKHITTAEGGMITTNSKELYDKLIMLRSHGMTKNSSDYLNNNEGPWYHEMQFLGYNYRLSDVQCALGISQLSRIEKFVSKRREIAKKYDEEFENNNEIEIIKETSEKYNPYHLYVIKVKDSKIRKKLFNYLKEKEIFCQVHYIPVYLHPYYKKLDYKKGLCPKSEEFYEKIISIPIYPLLSELEQNKVIKEIRRFLNENSCYYSSKR